MPSSAVDHPQQRDRSATRFHVATID